MHVLKWFISTSPANIYLSLRNDNYVCLSQQYILLLRMNESKNIRCSAAIRRRAAATATDLGKQKYEAANGTSAAAATSCSRKFFSLDALGR